MAREADSMGAGAAQQYDLGRGVAGSPKATFREQKHPAVKNLETLACNVQGMTARDKWTVRLKCSDCGRSGEASLSQEDGWSFMHDQSTQIDTVSEGFRAVPSKDRRSVDFFCAKCGKAAK
jgi:hypothetical protein